MAQYHQQPLLLLLLIAAAALISGVSTASSSDPAAVVEKKYGNGAWGFDDKYSKDYYKELGEYAVACHNQLTASHDHQLTFQRVISCDHFPGLTHKLTIAAADGGVTHTYEAVVCYKPLIQYKKLISFRLA